MSIRNRYRVARILGAELDPGLVDQMIRRTDAILAIESQNATFSGAVSEPERVYVMAETEIRKISRLSATFGSLRGVNYLREESAGTVVKPSLVRDTYAALEMIWDAQFAGARRSPHSADPIVGRAIAVALWIVFVRNWFRRVWSRMPSVDPIRSIFVRK